MDFNLYFSDELNSSFSQGNKYKVFKYGIKKDDECNIHKSFNITFKKDHHKKTHGKTLIIGGDKGYMGSILLSGTSALRTGSRYVEILTIKDHSNQIQLYRPELIVRDSYKHINDSLQNYSCLVIGPGMSEGDWSLSTFEKIFTTLSNGTYNVPIVADAGFLNLLSKKKFSYENWVLTPHPGEAAQMLGSNVSSIQENRISSAITLKEKFGGAVLLKGNKSVLVIKDNIYICNHGNQSMGTAGMGDCLTGVLTSFITMLQSGLDYRAILYAIALHSYSADLLSSSKETVGILATDVIEIMNKIINGKELYD
tara:strand:+ start:526 stop:1458 length:933 start_codon:yes stop_codon:yes gene_type:complete